MVPVLIVGEALFGLRAIAAIAGLVVILVLLVVIRGVFVAGGVEIVERFIGWMGGRYDG